MTTNTIGCAYSRILMHCRDLQNALHNLNAFLFKYVCNIWDGVLYGNREQRHMEIWILNDLQSYSKTRQIYFDII